jgi:hypothetical protein
MNSYKLVYLYNKNTVPAVTLYTPNGYRILEAGTDIVPPLVNVTVAPAEPDTKNAAGFAFDPVAINVAAAVTTRLNSPEST